MWYSLPNIFLSCFYKALLSSEEDLFNFLTPPQATWSHEGAWVASGFSQLCRPGLLAAPGLQLAARPPGNQWLWQNTQSHLTPRTSLESTYHYPIPRKWHLKKGHIQCILLGLALWCSRSSSLPVTPAFQMCQFKTYLLHFHPDSLLVLLTEGSRGRPVFALLHPQADPDEVQASGYRMAQPAHCDHFRSKSGSLSLTLSFK